MGGRNANYFDIFAGLYTGGGAEEFHHQKVEKKIRRSVIQDSS